MSPSLREINGPRPSPLNIRRGSHQIQKPSSSTTTTNHHRQHHRQPVIIYTHSPKVIHTKARDFMALVQKLTGMSRSPDDDQTSEAPQSGLAVPAAGTGTTEAAGDVPAAAAELDLGFDIIEHMSLFSRGSSDFFCPPRNFYLGGWLSPPTSTFMDAMP